MLLKARSSLLLVVDVQEALLPAMADPGRVTRGASILMRAAAILGVPVVVSEQYPKGLGHTVAGLAVLAPDRVHEKLSFSCLGDEALAASLLVPERPAVVLCGIEAHVCVLQTALALKAHGAHPFVVADATASRRESDHALALSRLAAAGVGVGSVEMVVFEWMERAGTPDFKAISKLIR
jgi:nicotinamidase-related amidase